MVRRVLAVHSAHLHMGLSFQIGQLLKGRDSSHQKLSVCTEIVLNAYWVSNWLYPLQRYVVKLQACLRIRSILFSVQRVVVGEARLNSMNEFLFAVTVCISPSEAVLNSFRARKFQ